MAQIHLIENTFAKKVYSQIIGDKENEITIGNTIDSLSSEDFIILFLDISDFSFNNINKIEEEINKIKNQICELVSKSRLIVQSVHPTRNKYLNELIQMINETILEFCYQMDIEYIDIYDLLTDREGLLATNYTDDNINLNEKCCNLIVNQINDFIFTNCIIK